MSINTTDDNTEPTLEQIIASIEKEPTIVNPNSNFVVVTYWWGRGYDNPNIARPCLSFYETFATQISKYTLKYLTVLYSQSARERGVVMKNNPELIVKHMPTHVSTLKSFVNMVKYFVKMYIDGLYTDINLLDNKDPNRFNNAKRIIEQMKRENTCPAEFNLLEKSKNEFQFREKVYKYLNF